MALDDITSGLELLFQADALAYLIVGLLAGFIIGVLPGFGGASAAALALPFSIGLSTESALILMAGIYAGASFSGAIPGILINVPGTAGAAATALEGYPLTKMGRSEFAISVARMSSTLGGVLAIIVVLIVIGPLSKIALNFGNRELFIVALFGLVVIASVIGKDFRKGLMAALLGLLVAAMPVSPVSPRPRFTMGFRELYDAVPFVPAVVGLFAITEMLLLIRRKYLVNPAHTATLTATGQGGASHVQELWNGIRETLAHPMVVVRSSALGLFIGCIPGVGTAVANFISYGEEKRRDKRNRFGKGAPEGIIASEACDNAVTGGTMVPTFTLGIPGSGTAAVMLSALVLHGVQPGPRVMVTHAPEAYSVFLGLLLASLLILPLGILFATPLAQIVRIPSPVLAPVVLILAVAGCFAVRNSLFDAALALVFGVVGVLMRLGGYPIVPMVIGLILGPILESSLIRALELSNYRLGYMFESPTALVMWGLLLFTVASRLFKTYRDRQRSRSNKEENIA